MGRLLLVGNSRWHWAERPATGGTEVLHCWHEPGPPPLPAGPGDPWGHLEAWAGVGTLPPERPLPPERRIGLEQVPLQRLPPWLGIDRALTGWRAWSRQGGAVLVADAGTCLSLTCIDGDGGFRGGRLSAGLALQLRSLGEGTARLPAISAPDGLDEAAAGGVVWGEPPWPAETAGALAAGCLRACAAAVALGWRERPAGVGWRLWLTGGDGALLAPLLRQQGIEAVLAPDLAMEALAALA